MLQRPSYQFRKHMNAVSLYGASATAVRLANTLIDMLSIAAFHGEQTIEPRQADLADILRCSRQTICACLKWLDTKGVFLIEKRHIQRNGKPYQLPHLISLRQHENGIFNPEMPTTHVSSGPYNPCVKSTGHKSEYNEAGKRPGGPQPKPEVVSRTEPPTKAPPPHDPTLESDWNRYQLALKQGRWWRDDGDFTVWRPIHGANATRKQPA